MSKNNNLLSAKKTKNDEFYTQYRDVEAEMNAYYKYNCDVFRNKIILCPCDDPEWSNFTKYFIDHFYEYEIKELICSCYVQDKYGKIMRYCGDDLHWDYLEGDGDFRSKEVTKLRDEADIIMTNPPFSLWREMFKWLIDSNKMFSIVGNQNAITYKEVFPYIKDNKVWLGPSIHSGGRDFRIPDDYDSYSNNVFIKDGHHYINLAGVRWFTNIDHGQRHEPLQLITTAENLKYNHKLINKCKKEGWIDENGKPYYPHYDNYDAIEVPITKAIPSDYVPCWFNCPSADKCPWAQSEGLDNDKTALCEVVRKKKRNYWRSNHLPRQILSRSVQNHWILEHRHCRRTTLRKILQRMLKRKANQMEWANSQTKNVVFQNTHSEENVMASSEYQSPSLINITHHNLKLSESPIALDGSGNIDALPLLKEKKSTTEYSFKKCNGILSVPITYLDKYCSSQFVLIGVFNHGTDGDWDFGKAIINGKELYKRIAIRKA